ncbi:interferon-induced protein 44-like [Sinocyclocheilus anshuiensis]|uniref:interferon-induced protein 44-like n=1 Tax=Sinocyclocheilus anshuiensis TaxID=1608454 RepID=UPI0007BA0732|nr:PREDICTED: interferon-induced protein 44-like [Sinocyclocheilus anshuiensis]
MSFFGTHISSDTKSSTTPTILSFGLGTSSGTKSTVAAVPTFASLATSSETSSTPPKASFALATSSGTKSDRNKPKKVAVPQFSLGAEFPLLLENEWRNMKWSEEVRETLMESVRSFKPTSETVTEARVLLIGPVGAGKSSFISSVQSVFSGRVINRAMVGSSSSTSFTKKLRSYNIRGAGEKADEPTALVLCDVMGVGEGESTGLSLHDALSVIKGCAPEGHQDSIKNNGVHQAALLTHVDQVCTATRRDITKVYKSQAVQQAMVKAGELLGMATSYIVPVKNYCSELDLDENTDILLLSAVDHILQYVNLYFQDNSD